MSFFPDVGRRTTRKEPGHGMGLSKVLLGHGRRITVSCVVLTDKHS